MNCTRRLALRSSNFFVLFFWTWLFILRTHVVVLAATSLAGAGATVAIIRQCTSITIVAAAAPLLVATFVGLHETAHWITLRWCLASRSAGVLISQGPRIALRRPALQGRRLLVVSASGPVVAGVTAAVCAWLVRGDYSLAFVFAAIGVSNLYGLSPWSGDGQDIARALS